MPTPAAAPHTATTATVTRATFTHVGHELAFVETLDKRCTGCENRGKNKESLNKRAYAAELALGTEFSATLTFRVVRGSLELLA